MLGILKNSWETIKNVEDLTYCRSHVSGDRLAEINVREMWY